MRLCRSLVYKNGLMVDLIFRGANLPDGRNHIDVGIEGDRIVAVEPHLKATAAEEITATMLDLSKLAERSRVDVEEFKKVGL